MKPAKPRCRSLPRGHLTLIRLKLTCILFLFIGCQLSASTLSNKSSTSVLFNDQDQLQIGITGQVTDAVTGEPLAGVNIVIAGTTTGEVTNNEGNFSISVPDENTVLVFSYIGFTTLSVEVGTQRVINLSMTPEAQEIDEVVAIGYGTIRKSDLTGAVSSVNQEDIEKVSPDNILTALQGWAPGVYISQNTGAPGEEPVIRIRGTGSVNEHSPIYVIDGMIMDISDVRDNSSTINFLNPADIASIEVLKDASATAIYGSRGANGVILITTHKGFDSSPRVSFSAQLGLSRIRNLPEKLRADDYIQYTRSYYGNGYSTTQPDTLPEMRDNLILYNDGYDTDWYGEILKDRPALSQNYNLSVTGGTSDARYSASFGYYNEEGIIITNSSDYDRYSFRINTDFNLGKFVRLGENLSISQMNRIGIPWGSDPIFRSVMYANPLYPALKQFDITDPDHPLYADPDDFMYAEPGDPGYDYYKYSPGAEPLAALSYNRNVQIHRLSIFGNVFAEATLLKDFTFRSSLGLNLSNSKIHDFEPAYFVSESDYSISGSVYRNLFWTNGWLWENTLTYHKTYQNHTITALAGYTSEYNKYEYLHAVKTGTPSNDPEMQTLDAATSITGLSGSHDILTMISLLGRINYSFKDRYLLTASIRRDGSSKFGPGYKWGMFPSVAIGWKISNEPFFEELRSKILPHLKLRAGWGQIGNSSMNENNTNAYVSQYATGPEFRALFGNDQPYSGYSFETIGIPNLTWETIEQVNVGLDIGMFRNALTLNADYYIRTTRDMLVLVGVPSYSGYLGNVPWINAGTVENRGFECIINYKGNAGRFTYNISANASTYKNTVLSTNQDNTDLTAVYNPAITRVGYPIGSFYGFVTDGIFQTVEEVQAYVDEEGNPIQPGAVPGDFRFKDLNGDGAISAGAVWDTTGISGDQTIIGNGHPDLIYGFSLNLGFRGFDLMTFWQGILGNELWNTQRTYIQGNRESYLASWDGEGTSNTFPRITSNDNNQNFRNSDFYVEDGSYLRMKHIQIGYTLPESLVRKLHITSCRIYVGGDDLITITSYSGIDPEVGLGDPLWTGVDGRLYYDGGIYPRSKRITMGIQIEF